MIHPNQNPLYQEVRRLLESHGGILGNNIILILNNYTCRLGLLELAQVYSAVSQQLDIHYQLSTDPKVDLDFRGVDVNKSESRMQAWLSILEDRIRLLADCTGMPLNELTALLSSDSDNVSVKSILRQ
ncbi:hypothetical protein [Vibrio owensii]|uniref:hypothetical protein n=1 Tax=Vibrio owensii TaxID=696485 RepID=UPI003CC63AEC